MRIRLPSDYQKNLLGSLKGNRTWKQLAESLGISEGVLSGVLSGNTLPDYVYEKIRSAETDKIVIERLSDNWGRVKAGKISDGGGRKISVACPQPSAKLAEVIGILFGDGSIYANPSKGVYQVKVALNIKLEQEYGRQFVQPLFKELFGLEGKVVSAPRIGVMYLYFSSRELVGVLGRLGIPPGLAKRSAGIPAWIKERDDFLAACLRGLIDTDGSIFRLSKRDYKLLRISFKNTNSKLLEDARLAFLKLGFHPSKLIQNNQFFLTRKEDVRRYAAEIGFNNPKNKQRLEFLSSKLNYSPVV